MDDILIGDNYAHAIWLANLVRSDNTFSLKYAPYLLKSC